MKLYKITQNPNIKRVFNVVADNLTDAVEISNTLTSDYVGESYRKNALSGEYLYSIFVEKVEVFK